MRLIKRLGYFKLLIIITTFYTATSMADISVNIQREDNFDTFVAQELSPFWQNRVTEGVFNNNQGLDIHFAFAINPKATKDIVISPGRVEGYLKYQELVFDLYHQGYSVFIIDHQGQGLSTRMLSNPHKGYVENFEDYVADFHQFIEQEVKPVSNKSRLLLCHSMGSAIGLRYIQQYPNQFEKAVFSSPMLRFNTGAVPRKLAQWLLFSINAIQSLFGDSAYFFGSKDYQALPFEGNELTNSEARYQHFRQLYEQQPSLQLGGVTYNWIVESTKAIDEIFANVDKISIPFLIIQADKEMVVDNEGQNEFCALPDNKHCLNNKPTPIENGKHELFIETDAVRNQTLQTIFRFWQ